MLRRIIGLSKSAVGKESKNLAKFAGRAPEDSGPAGASLQIFPRKLLVSPRELQGNP
jgi:hypothetical protein